jgi:serine/threonine protein kinase/formylglycine-generating enzyme required for sulfatase activity
MNSDGTTRTHFPQSFAASRQIDEACTRFEQALRRGELPAIEEVVLVAAPETRQLLLHELLKLEMEFRSKLSEAPQLEEYKRRFPDQIRFIKYLYYEYFIPAQIGEFAIQRLLGRGSFGLVYQGWDSKLSRSVAIKVFRRNPDDSETRSSNLLREARAAAQLRHPGVVAVYAVMPDADGDEFLVLEYVDGRSLKDLLRSERLTPTEAATLLLVVVRALQHAHQNGLIHRDLKPANILLDQARRPRVTDFGLALDMVAARRSPELAGTLSYMAPEQANGETHRLDARTDLWAVGVTLYRSLTGSLPFTGSSQQELLDAIRYQEPKDPLEHDAKIPAELARIVRRCLAKRMSERYQSAAELADDLSAFLTPVQPPEQADLASHDALGIPAAVVPKGLRCFDQGDRDFFLWLVPGPHDRRGVPQSIRFWENHLSERSPDKTFRVGLLYGPSGCGKSSLVRAGIGPRLEHGVHLAVIEATREGTELRLTNDLRRKFPDISENQALPEMLAELRENASLLSGEKLVIVLDQFEQWLHGWRQDEGAMLVDALRQCDGGRVQALVMVRDDFWMPTTRFFKQLDIPLVDGFNASAVDLFDQAHARAVLGAFGVSYGRLSSDQSQRSTEQQRFLERAVRELSVDGWIVPVRLCIFSEMVKSRPWTPATLRDMGGTKGLGTAFLEEVFDSRSASPTHRLYRKAARGVLERLLPPAGSQIRGHLVPESELQAASGYAHEPAEFAALMRCLDQELRLVTPSDVEIAEASNAAQGGPHGPRLYQLTHDFLVTAIRGWLNQTRRRTLRGRAELRLTEYAGAYAALSEARQLPSWWEWLNIAILTHRRRWKDTERSMMRAATRRHAVRAGVVIAAAAALALVVYDRIAATRADGLVQALATSESRDVPGLIERLRGYRWWASRRLDDRLAANDQASDERTRLLLGSMAVGDARTDELHERLLDADPPLALTIGDLMQRYGRLESLEPQLQAVARDAQSPRSRRLRACAALAHLKSAASAAVWEPLAADVSAMLLTDLEQNRRFFDPWVNGLEPVRKWLTEPLCSMFSDPALAPPQQVLAAEILAKYAADDPPRLVELGLRATPAQFKMLARPLVSHADVVRPVLVGEAGKEPSAEASEDEKDRLARRRANALLLLDQLGNDERVWPALQHRPDPRLRSFLLHHFCEAGAPADCAQRLAQENDPGIRQALILILGYTTLKARPAETPAEVSNLLVRIYREDVDSGVHSAAEWALRTLDQGTKLDEALTELSRLGVRPGYRWYVTPSRITMIIVEPPGEVLLGSPESEPGRDESDETQWKCVIDWPFAISATEITQDQYAEICPEYSEYGNEFAPSAAHPVNAVSWFDAVTFCRLLSEREGVPASQMVIPAASAIKSGNYSDIRERTGYRLPTEPEWEVACRAGTVTPRFFGHAPDLLPWYSCYIGNSGGQSAPVGGKWPNPMGLFDALGNVSEWCYGAFAVRPGSQSLPLTMARGYLPLARYGVRGNDYTSSARMLRAANRRSALPDEFPYSRGFRIAQTVLRKAAHE